MFIEVKQATLYYTSSAQPLSPVLVSWWLREILAFKGRAYVNTVELILFLYVAYNIESHISGIKVTWQYMVCHFV